MKSYWLSGLGFLESILRFIELLCGIQRSKDKYGGLEFDFAEAEIKKTARFWFFCVLI